MATQTLFYSAKRLDGKSGISRTETHDTEYGRFGKQVYNPYLLALPKNGKYLTKSTALTQLNKPIWGPNGNQPFYELLPVLPPAVSQYLSSGDYYYPWHEFDPNDTSTWPTENPDNGRGWECEDKTYPGRYYQNLFIDTCPIWGMLNIYRYRKQKRDLEVVVIDNPDYPIVEAERESKYEELVNLVKSTLVPMGYYSFATLPVETKVGYTPYTWKIDGVVTTPTYDFQFATANGGFKNYIRPMRKPEPITIKWRDNKTGQTGTWVKDAWEIAYETFCFRIKDLKVDPSIPDGRVKKLLGI